MRQAKSGAIVVFVIVDSVMDFSRGPSSSLPTSVDSAVDGSKSSVDGSILDESSYHVQ